jgi:hypothetical protein
VSPQGFCAVCGRTFLVGEGARSYVSVEGRHEVCELCAERAAGLGWLPADEAGAEEKLRAEAGRKTGFFAKLFARPEREERPASAPSGAPAPIAPPSAPAPAAPRASHELDTERYDVEAEWAERRPARPPRRPAPPQPDPAGRGMRPRRIQPDVSPKTRFERAIVRFNAGDAGRTVAGLTRTLGAPSVSVGDLAGEAEVIRVTVAWELTWYQWGVDLGDELRPVYELAKGFEVAEIDAAARQWNASAHDGRVVMVAPSRRPAANGRPVHG